MLRPVDVVAILGVVLFEAFFSLPVCAAQNDQIIGYNAETQTLMVYAIDESEDSSSLHWYRNGVLIRSTRAVAGALFVQEGKTYYVVLDCWADPFGEPKLDITIFNSEFHVVKTRNLSSEIDWFVPLEEQNFRITHLNDGSFVVEIFGLGFRHYDQWQFVVLSSDFSEYSLHKHIGNGALVSVTERDLANFDSSARRRFIAIGETQRDYLHYEIGRLRYDGRFSAFVCDFHVVREIDPNSTALDRTGKLLFNTSHAIVAPPEGSGTSEPISNLYFDATDACVWYSIATMMQPAPSKSVLELQCHLEVDYTGGMHNPTFRIYDRANHRAIQLTTSLEEYFTKHHLTFHAILDSIVLDDNEFGVLLQLYSKPDNEVCEFPYRYAVMRISRDGSFVLSTVFNSKHQQKRDLIQRKLELKENGLVVTLDEPGYWAFYHFSNGNWQEVSIRKGAQ